MRRLTLLLVALSVAVVAPVAHAAPVGHGGPTAHAAQAFPGDRDGDGTPDSIDQCPDVPGGNQGCPSPPGNAAQAPPADRDGDGVPDSADMCPDAPGMIGGCPDPDGDHFVGPADKCPGVPGTLEGCPDRDRDGFPDSSDPCPDEHGNNVVYKGCLEESVDRDGDGVWDKDDACPDMNADMRRGGQANGCFPLVFRYFFGVQKGVKDFAADKRNDTTYCSGGPLTCKTAHMTLTLSAQTAKAAGIKNRRIGSISRSLSLSPGPMGFDRGISRANQKKLARLKKITVTIHAWVILTTGQKLDTPKKTLTLSRNGYSAHQFNTDGSDPEGI